MIRIGPAGWSYKDWQGIVYPASKPKGFQELTYISEFFDTVEINVTFYRPIPAHTSESWLKKVEKNKRFKFTGKLWQGFTHDRNAGAEDERMFKDGYAPLLEAGRLGAILLQFPWSFRNTDENRHYVARLQQRFQDYPLVLEVRHASWHEVGMLDWLHEMDIGLCNIDQPLFHKSIKPGAEVTSSVGYVRLHGRNYKNWFAENAQSHERYDYLYTVDELEPWVDRVKAVAAKSSDTYAVTNNHYVGKATVNALEMTSLLKGEPVKALPQLLAYYPALAEFTVPG
ncbi:MAG: DUF72 domain-containing protein [Bryobacteraceae bacterium]